MAERIRLSKVATRKGRPATLDDGTVIEGDELEVPTPGMSYLVRRLAENGDAPEMFSTTPVRAVIRQRKSGAITLMTDNSHYKVEIVGN